MCLERASTGGWSGHLHTVRARKAQEGVGSSCVARGGQAEGDRAKRWYCCCSYNTLYSTRAAATAGALISPKSSTQSASTLLSSGAGTGDRALTSPKSSTKATVPIDGTIAANSTRAAAGALTSPKSSTKVTESMTATNGWKMRSRKMGRACAGDEATDARAHQTMHRCGCEWKCASKEE